MNHMHHQAFVNNHGLIWNIAIFNNTTKKQDENTCFDVNTSLFLCSAF